MKLTVNMITNLKTKEVVDKVKKATDKALLSTMVAIASDVIHLSPHISGHNRRSIAYKVGGKVTALGTPQGNEKPFESGEPDINESQAAIYSTSGYGGFLETGTVKRSATPYFKPALDKNIKKLPEGIRAELK